MPVSFNYIPQTLRLPLFWAEIDPSRAGSFVDYQRALVFGYRTTAAGASYNAPVRITNADQARATFGAGSQLANMMETWFKGNSFDEVWSMPIQEPAAGTAATGTITVAGPATASGIIALYIAGRKVDVKVTSSDAATAIATAIAAAVTASGDLPVTAAANAAVVTLTCRWKGEDGNGIDVRHSYRGELGSEALPAGVTLTIAAMSGGVGVPTLTTAVANLGDEPFDTVVIPWTDSTTLDAIDAEWTYRGDNGRWSWMRQVYGQVYTARDGTVGALQTFGAVRNGESVSCFGYRGSPTPAWRRAVSYAAAAHRALINDPARPLHTLDLVDVLPAPREQRFTKAERNGLAYDGISTAIERADGSMAIETSFTMYQVNLYGQADDAFLKIQTKATLAYVLRYLRARVQQVFPRHKLANDGTRYGPGQAIATPSTIRAEILAAYRELEFLGLVENAAAFAATLIVERNANNPNRVDVLFAPDLVNQLDVFAVLAQFRLQYPTRLPDQALPPAAV